MQVDLDDRKPERREKPYDLDTFRVMIIEDSTFIASLLSSTLSEMGVGSITTANNIAAAKEKLLNFNAVQSSQNIDVLIVDWLMPDGDGGEFISWLRKHRSDPIKFVPVIVCSAYASTELVEERRDVGANEEMVKPASAEKLATRLL